MEKIPPSQLISHRMVVLDYFYERQSNKSNTYKVRKTKKNIYASLSIVAWYWTGQNGLLLMQSFLRWMCIAYRHLGKQVCPLLKIKMYAHTCKNNLNDYQGRSDKTIFCPFSCCKFYYSISIKIIAHFNNKLAFKIYFA